MKVSYSKIEYKNEGQYSNHPVLKSRDTYTEDIKKRYQSIMVKSK